MKTITKSSYAMFAVAAAVAVVLSSAVVAFTSAVNLPSSSLTLTGAS